MKKISFLILLFISLCNAQDYQIQYAFTYYPTGSTVTKTELYETDISKDQITFFPLKMEKVDSLFLAASQDVYKLPREVLTQSAGTLSSKYHPKDNYFQELKFLDDGYYLVKTNFKKFHWQLTGKQGREASYKVQEATTRFGGRDWVAQFTDEIPLPYGPYIFKDLPGLIISISDSENKYRFDLLRIRKRETLPSTELFFETDFGDKRPVLSQTQFIKIKQQLYKTPVKPQEEHWPDQNAERRFVEERSKHIRDLLADGKDIFDFYDLHPSKATNNQIKRQQSHRTESQK